MSCEWRGVAGRKGMLLEGNRMRRVINRCGDADCKHRKHTGRDRSGDYAWNKQGRAGYRVIEVILRNVGGALKVHMEGRTTADWVDTAREKQGMGRTV